MNNKIIREKKVTETTSTTTTAWLKDHGCIKHNIEEESLDSRKNHEINSVPELKFFLFHTFIHTNMCWVVANYGRR
jgi:hypothetical protein